MKPPDLPEFDRYASDYDSLLRDPIRERFAGEKSFFVERKLDVILRFFQSLSIDTHSLAWLDVGCGQGDLLRLGRARFGHVAGCDPSDRMLESCRDLEVWHQSSMDRLPFPDASFDFLTVVCVYHHVKPEQRPGLTSELLRVIRPGGFLCVIEHNPFNPATRLIVSRTPIDADARLLSSGLTRRLLSSAGAQVVTTQYFLLLPERLFRFFAPIENLLSSIPVAGQYVVFAKRLRR